MYDGAQFERDLREVERATRRTARQLNAVPTMFSSNAPAAKGWGPKSVVLSDNESLRRKWDAAAEERKAFREQAAIEREQAAVEIEARRAAWIIDQGRRRRAEQERECAARDERKSNRRLLRVAREARIAERNAKRALWVAERDQKKREREEKQRERAERDLFMKTLRPTVEREIKSKVHAELHAAWVKQKSELAHV